MLLINSTYHRKEIKTIVMKVSDSNINYNQTYIHLGNMLFMGEGETKGIAIKSNPYPEKLQSQKW